MNVLVVDDNRGTLNALELWLARSGLRAIPCVDPQEGLRRLGECLRAGEPVDLVLTDHILPGLAGLEFIGLCRQLLPGIKAILMTAYQDDELRRQAEAMRGCRFLAKPFTPEDLREALRDLELAHAG